MATTDKDLQAQLAGAHATIKEGQTTGNQAAIDKGMAEQSAILKDNGIIYPTGNKGANVDTSTTPLPKSWGGTGISSGGSSSSGKSSSSTSSSGSATVQYKAPQASNVKFSTEELMETVGSVKEQVTDPLKSSSAGDITSQLVQNAEDSFDIAKQQQESRIDYAVQQGVTELERAQEDAQEQFDTQQKQVDIDEARAMDNQALYAEARGDRGGIGRAQYAQIQNTAMNNRRAINSARTKLATDTARQIADLRAQGEFQKADALLQLTQSHLAQLADIQKWGAEFTLQEHQFNAQLDMWASDFAMQATQLGIQVDQWVAEFNQQNAQFATQVNQWNTEFNQQREQWLTSQQNAAKENLAQAGVQAATLGMDVTPAQQAAMKELYGYDETWVAATQAAYTSTQTSDATAKAQKAAADRCEQYVSVGLTPDPEDVKLAGWSDRYVQARVEEYKRKNTKATDSGNNTKTALTYQGLYDGGYRTAGDAYAYLISQGYTATEAQNIVDYYSEWLGSRTPEVDVEARWDGKTGYAHIMTGQDNGVFGTHIKEALTEAKKMLLAGKSPDEVWLWLDNKYGDEPTQLTRAGIDYLQAEIEGYKKLGGGN